MPPSPSSPPPKAWPISSPDRVGQPWEQAIPKKEKLDDPSKAK